MPASILMSCATGNLTSAATWALIDSTSYLNSESANTALTTSYVSSSTFTPGVITIDGIAIKIANRTGTTGTITVALDLASVDVTGTIVTINVSDLNAVTTAGLDGGWYLFKFAAPVTLLAATAYSVKAKTSSSSQVNLFSSATTNWSRALRTTTTQAPVAGDDMIVIGEHTGAGTGNSFVVTMNETATTDYGQANTSLVAPAIGVGKRGTIKLGVAASTNYNLKVSGHIISYSGGVINFLQAGDSFPSTSTFTLLIDCVSNADFLITCRNGGTLYFYGTPKTACQTLLTGNAAVAATVLTLASTSGWANSDEIAIATTTRTSSQSEKRTISTVDSSTQVTVSSGLTNAHNGTSPTQAEVVNLTRNIKLLGTSVTVCTAIDLKAGATFNASYIQCKFLGTSASVGAINSATTVTAGGTCTITGLTFESTQSASYCFISTGTESGTISLTNSFAYNVGNFFNIAKTSTGSGTDTYDSLGVITCTNGFFIATLRPTITNIWVTGATQRGITGSAFGVIYGTFSGWTVHSCDVYALDLSQGNLIGGTISNIKAWRNGTMGLLFGGCYGVTFDTAVFFGNASQNYGNSAGSTGVSSELIFKNIVSAGDSSFAAPLGLYIPAYSVCVAYFIDCDFSQASGIYVAHSTADIDISNANALDTAPFVRLTFENCRFGSTPFLATSGHGLTKITDDSFVRILSKNRTAGADEYYDNVSKQTPDIVIYSAASPSLRILPTATTRRARSAPINPPDFMGSYVVPVASGGTVTVSVKVRESAAGDAGGSVYNGARARLYVRQNTAAGVTVDTLLATGTSASAGAWETLSGTTVSVSRDAVLEFYIDCAGSSWTTGWLNVDDWSS